MAEILAINNQWVCIFGLRGSGKSQLAKAMLRTTPSHIVYDPLAEYAGFRRYTPNDNQSKAELSEFIMGTVIPNKPDLFVIDEGNTYIEPKPTRLPEGVKYLNDFSRHYGIAVVVIARRPSQFHSDIVELSDLLMVFKLPGPQDVRALNLRTPGLGDTVRTLDKYHFVISRPEGEFWTHSPLKIPA